MSNEEKQILIKDLSARLPYGVMCNIQTCFVFEDGTVRRGSYDKILDLDTVTEINEWKETGELEKFKPYLRPLSSMTEEERKKLISEFGADIRDEDNGRHTEEYGYVMIYHNFQEESWFIPFEAIDWLNAHHFDFRGLIEKSLALEAPEGMYNIK